MNGGLNTYGYVDGNPLNWIDPYGLYEEDVQNLTNWIEKHTNVTMPAFGGFKDLPLDTGGYYDRDAKKYYLNETLYDRSLVEHGVEKLCTTMVHESFHPDDNALELIILGIEDFFDMQLHQNRYRDRAETIINDALNKDGVPPLPAPTPFKPERGR
jgi:hypothetical protein